MTGIKIPAELIDKVIGIAVMYSEGLPLLNFSEEEGKKNQKGELITFDVATKKVTFKPVSEGSVNPNG